MGWLRYSSSVRFLRRVAITVDNSAAAAAVTLDVDVTIPKDFHAFWSVIDNAGDKIRVTGPDGVTAVSYDIDDGAGGAFDATAVTNRTGRIRIDGMTIPTGTAGIFLLWLYYAPNGLVTDGSSAVTMTSVGSGYIDLDEPAGPYLAEHAPQGFRSSIPRDGKAKAPAEQVYLWIRVDRALARHRRASEGSRVREELYYATMAVLNISASDQTAMYALASNRFVWRERDQSMWLKCLVKAGTTNTRYTAEPTFHTCLPFAPAAIHKTHTARFGLAVRRTILES